MKNQNISIATKNQIFLFSILEMLIDDLKYNIQNVYFVRDKLSFDFCNKFYFIEIKDSKIIYDEYLLENKDVSKCIKKITFDFNETSFLNIGNEILSNKEKNLNSYNNDLNIQFMFCKSLMYFNVSIVIEDNILTITNIKNNNELVVTPYENNIHKVKIQKETGNDKYTCFYETYFEYIEEINKLSKFYLHDKKQQIIGIAMRIFENY